MADSKLSDLVISAPAAAWGATDQLYVVQGGVSKGGTGAQLKTWALSGANTFTALQTITQASANAGIIASTGYSLTGSNATSMVDLAGTWNTTGAPTAIKLNIPNTASDAASLLMDLRVGGVSKFNVGKGGVTVIAGLIAGLAGVETAGGGRFGGTSGIGVAYIGSGLELSSTYSVGWFSGSLITACDLALSRLGAGSLRQGLPASATPVAQILTVGEQGVGSDITNAGSTIRAGLATGNATVAPLNFQVGVIKASGTTVHTYATAVSVKNSTATGLQFNGYGAGAITADGSGNLTAASDPRMKNIQREFTVGLSTIQKIKPIVYRWKPETLMDSDNDYAGFDACNVRDASELLTWEAKDGTLSLQDRALLAACVNAINELAAARV